jgi:hypothetical protein
MSANHLYHTWLQRTRQLLPDARITRLRNFVWLMVGIYHSRSIHLSDVASKIPGRAKGLSTVRRLSRFLANRRVRVREWYAPIAGRLVESMAHTVGEIRLVTDSTKVGFHHQLLMVAIAYRRRALPLAWTWVRGGRGHSSAYKQRVLLAHVRSLIPSGIPVTLVGDSEFGAVPVMQQVERWHWRYVLRQKAHHGIQLLNSSTWQPLGQMISQPRQSLWLGPALLTSRHAYPVNLLAHWQAGEDTPWLLATNLSSRRDALRAYRRRMWIEEMFGDLKGHGFDLERTHLRHFDRLSRLTLAVAILYVWLISTGARAIKNGQRHWVDRNDRRDLRVFRIGLRLIERYLTNGLPISIPLWPTYGGKLSGS